MAGETDEVEYHVIEALRTDEGRITRADVEYDSEVESGVLEITYGSRRGDSLRERDVGYDDRVYTVKPQNFDEKGVEEVLVPEPAATGSVEGLVERVLGSYVETSQDSWAVEELE
ncbi:MAG: hypothetical protein ABEJ64_03815 [Candidatus Nanohaloarchaea archaeon]